MNLDELIGKMDLDTQHPEMLSQEALRPAEESTDEDSPVCGPLDGVQLLPSDNVPEVMELLQMKTETRTVKDPDGTKHTETNRKPISSGYNFLTIIHLDHRFSDLRLNTLRGKPERVTEGKRIPWTDADDADAKLYIETVYGITSEPKYKDALAKMSLDENSKEKRIKKELNRISKFFEKADGNQRALVAPLLQNAAFMAVTLEDLQETINQEGATDEYQNGANQRGMKQSATLQGYNALIKNYTTVIKTLSSILPPEEKPISVPWQPRAKTQEELEEERKQFEEERQRRDAELKAAIEWQKADKEGRTTLSFLEWQRENGYADNTPE